MKGISENDFSIGGIYYKHFCTVPGTYNIVI